MTVSLASFHGLRRDGAVTVVPSRTRSVASAMAASAIHGSQVGQSGSVPYDSPFGYPRVTWRGRLAP